MKDSPGLFRRLFAGLRRAILNKSSEESTTELTGGEQYWNEALQASYGWPGRRPEERAALAEWRRLHTFS